MEKKSTDNLKILFFGLGSIGKKHAQIIKKNFNFHLYAYRTNKGQEKNDLNIQEFYDVDEAFSIKPDIAFITNPTFLHVSTALECVQRNISFFMEKPISHTLANLNQLEQELTKRKLFTYIGYNLRFHRVISNLKKIVSTKEKPIYFRVTCSSYLPSWRPEQDYQKSYSAKQELGGGVILDLSHEFDYLSWLFGGIKDIKGHYDKISNLNIESEDMVEAEVTCNSNIKGSVHLDNFSRNNERKIQIYYDDEYLEANLLDNTIKRLNRDTKSLKFQCTQDDTYIRQIKYFFDQYNKQNLTVMNNFSEALKTFTAIMKFKTK
jgi:predicted dehydrogenase